MRRSPRCSVSTDMQKPRVRPQTPATLSTEHLRTVVGGGRYPGFEQTTLLRSPSIIDGNGGT